MGVGYYIDQNVSKTGLSFASQRGVLHEEHDVSEDLVVLVKIINTDCIVM